MYTVIFGIEQKQLGQFPNFPEAFACLFKEVREWLECKIRPADDNVIKANLSASKISWKQVTVVAGHHDAEKDHKLDWFEVRDLAAYLGLFEDWVLKPVNVSE